MFLSVSLVLSMFPSAYLVLSNFPSAYIVLSMWCLHSSTSVYVVPPYFCICGASIVLSMWCLHSSLYVPRCLHSSLSVYSSARTAWPATGLASRGRRQRQLPWQPLVALSNNNERGRCLWRDLWDSKESIFFLLAAPGEGTHPALTPRHPVMWTACFEIIH